MSLENRIPKSRDGMVLAISYRRGLAPKHRGGSKQGFLCGFPGSFLHGLLNFDTPTASNRKPNGVAERGEGAKRSCKSSKATLRPRANETRRDLEAQRQGRVRGRLTIQPLTP